MFWTSCFLLCCMMLSCNAYIKCDNPPRIRSEGESIKTWPDNTVPFEITDVFSPDEKELIRSSLKELNEKTDNCVKFIEKTDVHIAWVRVVSMDGCYSQVGKSVETGYQDLSLDRNGCMFDHTVIHEFLHALGFNHEQTRPDRDNYAKILYRNIEPENRHNFDKEPLAELQSAGLPYDFNSIMHYTYDGFSVNCLPVIVPIGAENKKWRYTMGKGEKLTAEDILKVKTIYGCL